MKNPNSPHPKDYAPLSFLDGVGANLFWLDKKTVLPVKTGLTGAKAWTDASKGHLMEDVLITQL